MSTFIDTHCHLFNFVDIPVYETLEGKVSMNTAVKMLAAMSASGALISGLVKHKIHDYKDFIQFFERPQEENIKSLVHEIGESTEAKEIVLTPLVMDFDCVRQEKCDSESPPCTRRTCPLPGVSSASMAQDPSAEQQLMRLKAAIDIAMNNGSLPDGKTVRIYPFLGFDLRKLTPGNSNAFVQLKQLWGQVGVSKQDRQNGFSAIPNGKVLGIKLYPPIGFNPYPKERQAREKCVAFYEWCIDEQIPLTVHCQSGSYSAGRKQSAVDRDTHASNWRRLFEDWKNGKLGSSRNINGLRINFAHFGGEQGLEDMLDPFRLDGIDETSWTHNLVSLLKDYTNTYADVSAFDWSDKNAVKNFSKLLAMDKQGKLGSGANRVTHKLLWGSDVPMVLDSEAYKKNKKKKGEAKYKHLVKNFQDCVKVSEPDSDEEKDIFLCMTNKAPTNFLLH